MNDVTVVTSVTYPSPESLALVADVQYHEPYLSAALNRKFRGIVDPGFYAGFLPKPGGGMNLLITSVDGDKTAGAASVDIGEFYQVTIQHRKDISLALNAGKKYAIVLKGRYLLGEDTYQVNTASHIHAAEFVARTYTDSYQLGDGELLVCTVNIPAGVSTITQEMIDTSERINRTIGIDISDSVTSTRSDVAASSLAVKKAYDLAKSKYTAQDASTTQKGLVQLSSATNSTSEVLAATPKAVKAAYDLANGKYTAQDATTTQKGIVQLSSDTNSTSETLAATPKAVKAAYDLAAGKAPSSHTHPWNQITGVPTASLTAKGITQLSSATNSTSEVLAATPKAVKAAYDLANGKYTAQDATTTQKGIVQLSSDTNSTSETLAATPKAVKAAYDLAAGKAPSSHTHPWNQITGVPTASLTAKGITQLSSATNSTSEVLAATPKAVKAAYDLANGKQAADATLTALAALATAADKLPYFTGVDRAALTALTSVGRAILSKPSIQSVLNYLGLGEGSALPVGVPVPWPSATPPTGWLKCNGAAFSSEKYPNLAKVYPTLKLPDLRGEFIRGWDDGRGVDAGRVILSIQGWLTGSHYHNIRSWDAWDNTVLVPNDRGGDSLLSTDNAVQEGAINGKFTSQYRTELSGGNETRPRNIAFNYIVRAA
ncbi:tail fiber protein [Escherichia coli]|uniref:phage tail protein n=1 Tax=Escherichia coli TaxID=562 RepID=UPI001A1ACAE5|nr:tail fiber protein [Escherichia coli]EKU0944854.1 tail fiber protein [Escherichia coli]MBI9925577.1 tail fiber protein [Escherichia coli]MCF6640655.1 tail fiber protein [Escherichia coli]MDF7035647.1 tail fiber protein [Escherichia coli]